MKAEVLDFYTAGELLWEVNKKTGRNITGSTLRFWRHKLGIVSKCHGLYSKQQLDALISLGHWLNSSRTIAHFVDEFYEQLLEV